MKKSELFRLFREYFNTEIRAIVKEIVKKELKKAIKTNSDFSEKSHFSLVENKNLNEEKTVKKSKLFNNQIEQLLNEVSNRKAAVQKEIETYRNTMPVFDKRLFTSKNEQSQISNSPDDELTEDVIRQKQQIRDMYMNMVNKNAEIERMMSNNDMLKIDIEAEGVREVLSLNRNDASIPPELRKVFKRDYTQLVKSFSKKRNKNNE